MQKLRFLIVDDYSDNRTLLKEIVGILGHEQQVVENGLLAIRALEQKHFDIILMDVEMPVMNGIEATKEIRKLMKPPKCNIPIIAISAHNAENFEERLKKAGFNGFISKPYSLDKIIDLIDMYVQK